MKSNESKSRRAKKSKVHPALVQLNDKKESQRVHRNLSIDEMIARKIKRELAEMPGKLSKIPEQLAEIPEQLAEMSGQLAEIQRKLYDLYGPDNGKVRQRQEVNPLGTLPGPSTQTNKPSNLEKSPNRRGKLPARIFPERTLDNDFWWNYLGLDKRFNSDKIDASLTLDKAISDMKAEIAAKYGNEHAKMPIYKKPPQSKPLGEIFRDFTYPKENNYQLEELESLLSKPHLSGNSGDPLLDGARESINRVIELRKRCDKHTEGLERIKVRGEELEKKLKDKLERRDELEFKDNPDSMERPLYFDYNRSWKEKYPRTSSAKKVR